LNPFGEARSRGEGLKETKKATHKNKLRGGVGSTSFGISLLIKISPKFQRRAEEMGGRNWSPRPAKKTSPKMKKLGGVKLESVETPRAVSVRPTEKKEGSRGITGPGEETIEMKNDCAPRFKLNEEIK